MTWMCPRLCTATPVSDLGQGSQYRPLRDNRDRRHELRKPNVSYMINGGVFDRFPNLKVYITHGGGWCTLSARSDGAEPEP